MTRLQWEGLGLRPVRQKLISLGVEGEEELNALLSRIIVPSSINAGEDIIAPGQSPGRLTMLLTGVCHLYERLVDGSRQIYAFHYPGDFCDLQRHVLPETSKDVAVAAITACSIGTIDYDDLEQLITRYPLVGRALWRATVLEASIFQRSLLNVGRQPALRRVAHLLCEQLARQAAVCIDTTTIPLSQIDVADATGLSIVHVNRVFKELRRLGLLSKQGRTIKVANREQLARFGGFDGSYLNMPQLLTRWRLEIPSIPAHLARPPTMRLARTAATRMSSTDKARGRSDDKAERLSPPSH